MATTEKTTTRIGIVSSVDSDRKRARVYYPDMGDMVSGWLFVLQSGKSWMPSVKQRVLCLFMSGTDTDGYILGVIP